MELGFKLKVRISKTTDSMLIRNILFSRTGQGWLIDTRSTQGAGRSCCRMGSSKQSWGRKEKDIRRLMNCKLTNCNARGDFAAATYFWRSHSQLKVLCFPSCSYIDLNCSSAISKFSTISAAKTSVAIEPPQYSQISGTYRHNQYARVN